MRRYAADFAEATPWHTPWMKEVLPAVEEVARCHAARTIFTRFMPPAPPEELPGADTETILSNG